MTMLVISLVLGLAPLAGIGWIGAGGWLQTVDGLFMALMLLAIGGLFLINAVLQARALGLVPRRGKRPEAVKAEGAKA